MRTRYTVSVIHLLPRSLYSLRLSYTLSSLGSINRAKQTRIRRFYRLLNRQFIAIGVPMCDNIDLFDGTSRFAGFPGHLFVASSPIFEPSPETGEAKSNIINRRIFYQNSIPRWVHTGGNRPNHIVPVACVNVIIANDHKFSVHKLA